MASNVTVCGSKNARPGGPKSPTPNHRLGVKRPRQRNSPSDDSDSDELDTALSVCGSWARFLLIEATQGNEESLRRLSIFAIKKGIEGLTGKSSSAKKLQSGALLVECDRKVYSENLLATQRFVDIPVKALPTDL